MLNELLVFTKHSRNWRQNRYVYPVISRRSRGLSIGVNLNPDKACNFDCVYCSVDRTSRSPVRDVDLTVLSAELDQMLELAIAGEIYRESPLNQTPLALRVLRDVAFSGDGEPTSYSRFSDACRIVVETIARHGLPGVRLVLITNATLLHRPGVKEALAFLDEHNGEIWAKLDAGTEAYYRLVDRTKVPLRRVLDNIREAGEIRPIVIQSLFMRLHGQPPPRAEIDAYIGRLDALVRRGCRVRLVQVYTTARATRETYISPLEEAGLCEIAERVRRRGVAAEEFPSSA